MDIGELINLLKNDVSGFYFHRNYDTGNIELNIEFNNTDMVQALIDKGEATEINACAYWE